MSWYTVLTTDLVFQRETYDTEQSVDEAIEDEEGIRRNAEKDLQQLSVITEPSKMLCMDKDVDPIEYISQRCSDDIEQIKESTIHLFKLKQLKEDWAKCHTTKDGEIVAKSQPNNFDPPYLEGDFIKSDNADDA